MANNNQSNIKGSPSISDFISELTAHPVVRTNRFLFDCYNDQKEPIPADYVCENIEIPELGVNTDEFQLHNAPPILIPYSRNLGDNTFTVVFREAIVGGTAGIYLFFKKWAERVIIPNINTREYVISYYDDIMGNARLRVFDLNNNLSKLLDVNFPKIYPTSVKISTFDYADQNNIAKTTVKFYFEEIKVD